MKQGQLQQWRRRWLWEQLAGAMCVLALVGFQQLPAAESEALAGVSSGTAFAVNASGYLLTCAHVVADAAEVGVCVGDRKLPATVVATDTPHDLALLKVSADLPAVLPLAADGAVELGEEVRAFGFPLRSALGDTLKVTRGTVSGIERRSERAALQVDVAVNPGNSGGPLVNGHGEVVGVVSAKLQPAHASNVGFAVPTEYARALLQGQGVSSGAFSATGTLDGPEVVRRVGPAVALVIVRTGGGTREAVARSPATVRAAPVAMAAVAPSPTQWVAELPAQAAADYTERRAESLRTADPQPLQNWMGLWLSALSEPNRSRVELDYVELLLTRATSSTKARAEAVREASSRLEAVALRQPIEPDLQAALQRLRALRDAKSRR